MVRVANNTVSVRHLVEIINRRNRFSREAATVRQGWNFIAEEILLQTGNYRGFNLLGPNEVPAGELPGINEAGKADETRRRWRL